MNNKFVLCNLLSKIGNFFSSRAWLSLFTLLIFLGLFVGLSRVLATIAAPRPTASASGKDATRSGPKIEQRVACGALVVFFKPNATISQINDLLQRVDGTIIYGPNENEAYEIRLLTSNVVSIKNVVESSTAVSLVTVNPQCQ